MKEVLNYFAFIAQNRFHHRKVLYVIICATEFILSYYGNKNEKGKFVISVY